MTKPSPCGWPVCECMNVCPTRREAIRQAVTPEALKKRLEDRDTVIGVLRARCQLLEGVLEAARAFDSYEPRDPNRLALREAIAQADAPPKGAPKR